MSQPFSPAIEAIFQRMENTMNRRVPAVVDLSQASVVQIEQANPNEEACRFQLTMPNGLDS